MPEDTPAFWREFNMLRSDASSYAIALDDFVWRVFFPRRKREVVGTAKTSLFNFQKITAAVTGGGDSSDKPNPLLQHLASPSTSSLASSSLSSSGIGSSIAAQEKAHAAQMGFDIQKNRTFLGHYTHKALRDGNQPVNELVTLMQQLSLQKSILDERLEAYERYPTQFNDALSAVAHKLTEHDETKRQVLTKLTKYLGHKVGTNVEKALEQEKKIRTRRQLMSSLRFDASCDLRKIQHNEELNALKPIATALQMYADYFESGSKMMQPMLAQLAGLSAYIATQEEAAERQSQIFAMSKRAHETALVAALSANHSAATAALTTSLQGGGGGTGIRDLDFAARGAGGASKATEKEGYLFIPAPNFTPVYCTLSKGKINLNREAINAPDMNLDLVICTVKENRDAKLRWCFNIISPNETLLLQADSAEGYQEWMSVIQNAIGMQLNAGQSRPANHAHGHGHGHGHGGHGASSNSSSNTYSSSTSASAASPTSSATPSLSSSSHHAAAHSNSASHSGHAHQSHGGGGGGAGAGAGGSGHHHGVGAGSLFGKASDGASSSEALSVLRSVPGNDTCADCSAKDPDWVSLNLGIVICMEVSPTHTT